MQGSGRRKKDIGPRLLTIFEHIYIINLPTRADRRCEMEEQLGLIGLSSDHAQVSFFKAIRPSEAGEWPTLGARGAYFSHLGVLSAARGRGLRSVLILEDDVNWTRGFLNQADAILDKLEQQPWSYVHGGLEPPAKGEVDGDVTLRPVSPDKELLLAHFIGLSGDAVSRAEAYLQAIASRRAGDPAGGPMHVDGAYSWFRRDNPDVVTLLCDPAIAAQRASRTDIHDLKWFDRMRGISDLVNLCRAIVNKLRY